MELETDKIYAHVMGLSAKVLHLYLNQANLTTSGNKKALVERMLDNAIICSNAPSKGKVARTQQGQNEDEPAGQALQALMAKVDLMSAFRMVPVRPDDWNLLGRQPLTIKMLKELSQSLYVSKTHSTHDRLMLQAALAVAFFGFLRVYKFTVNSWKRKAMRRGRFLAKQDVLASTLRSAADHQIFQDGPVGERVHHYNGTHSFKPAVQSNRKCEYNSSPR
ncbi:hypothetical protein EMCRGX_G002846 [Ephydatia muelleri]